MGACEQDVVLITASGLSNDIIGGEFGDEDVKGGSLGGGLGGGDQGKAVDAGDHDGWDEVWVCTPKSPTERAVGIVVDYCCGCTGGAGEEGLDGEVASSS